MLVKHETLLGNWTCVTISVSKASQGEADVMLVVKGSNEKIRHPAGIKASVFFFLWIFFTSVGVCVLTVLSDRVNMKLPSY